jgi:hypothetical protein
VLTLHDPVARDALAVVLEVGVRSAQVIEVLVALRLDVVDRGDELGTAPRVGLGTRLELRPAGLRLRLRLASGRR